MLGTTAYDGFSGETRWYSFVQSSSLPARLWETAALVTFCLVVAGSLYAAAVPLRPSGRVSACAASPARSRRRSSRSPPGYLDRALLVAVGLGGHQRAGEDVRPPRHRRRPGSARRTSRRRRRSSRPGSSPASRSSRIITGHVLGVVAAHERAISLFPRRAAVLGQVPLLVLMVVYTVGGLTLLFSS